MNSNLKLTILLLISFIASGSVVYNIRSGRTVRPAVNRTADTLPDPVAPVIVETPGGEEIATDTTSAPVPLQPTNIPESGWGRNPFMTREEINAANAPPIPSIVETPVPAAEPTTPTPAGPPVYELSAIFWPLDGNPDRRRAVVNQRTLEQGDRLGYETIKEIKRTSIVLEYEGQTREVNLRRHRTQLSPETASGETNP